MQINSITKAMPKIARMLPVVATVVLSALTLRAKAEEKTTASEPTVIVMQDDTIKTVSDSITATAKGSLAARDNLTFEDPTNDSIAASLKQKRDTIYSIGTDIGNTHLGFNVEGTGAEEIFNRVTSDISLSSTGSQFSGIYKALKDEQSALEAKGLSAFDIESQLNSLGTLMHDYVRDNSSINREKSNETSVRSEFHYGADKSKVGHITQTLGLKGNGGIKDRRKEELEQLNDSTQQISDSTLQTTNKKGEFNGGVSYGLAVETENSDVRFIGDFASDNIDLALSAETRKNLQNGTLSASLSARETIEPEYHEGSGGVALDYKSHNNDLTTGAFGYYEYSKEKGEDADFCASAAAYLKYKKLVKLEVGDDYTKNLNYVYSKMYLTGKKELPDKDLKFNGRLTAEYGGFIFNPSMNIKPVHNVEVQARGNMVFNPESDMLATLGLGVNYGCQIDPNETDVNERYSHDVAANILGSFKKGKMEIAAMVSFLYNTYSAILQGNSKQDPLKISSCVTLGLQDLFEGITPFVSYTLNSGVQGLEHNIGGGINLGIDALSDKAKRRRAK